MFWMGNQENLSSSSKHRTSSTHYDMEYHSVPLATTTTNTTDNNAATSGADKTIIQDVCHLVRRPAYVTICLCYACYCG